MRVAAVEGDMAEQVVGLVALYCLALVFAVGIGALFLAARATDFGEPQGWQQFIFLAWILAGPFYLLLAWLFLF